jgi:glycosyl transferase family 87
MRSVPTFLLLSGSVFLAGIAVLAITKTPLGTPLFFACTAAMTAAYLAALARGLRAADVPPRAITIVYVMALAFRLPLAVLPVDANSDMMRYIWDGRVQRLGVNPYLVTPADPAVAFTHTDDTRHMPSARARTPYPPAAQLFFRLIVTLHESALAMKLAIVACELIALAAIRRWLALTGRNPLTIVAYAWNPLVVLETAHSGHIDAVGAMWIVLAALALMRRRTMLASVAFVLAVATKLLPVVLIPIFWRRVRVRDVAVAAALAAGLALPFVVGHSMPLGALPGVVAGVRFNGPAFQFIRNATSPQFAAAVAVAAGLLTAAWCRWKLAADDPAAWAWPMAVSLAFAPVIYPWYLLYFTPFLLTRATAPLIAWTIAVIPAYVVWELARYGSRWIVPPRVVAGEYGLVVLAGLVTWYLSRPEPHS